MTVSLSCPACGDTTVSVQIDADADQHVDGTWRAIYTVESVSPCEACGYQPEPEEIEDAADDAARDQAMAESGR